MARHRRGGGPGADSHGCGSAKRSRRYRPLAEKIDEARRCFRLAQKCQDKLVTRKIPSMLANRLISWIGGVPAARLRLLFESISPGIAPGCATLRRDASLHSDLRVMVGGTRHGDPGGASCAHDGQYQRYGLSRTMKSHLRP